MANPDKGEVDLPIGEETLVLRFTTNSVRHLENVLGKTIAEIVVLMATSKEQPGGLPIGTAQCLFWAALLDKRRGLSLEEAGELMDNAGHVAVSNAIGEAFTLYMPILSGEPRGNPQKAGR